MNVYVYVCIYGCICMSDFYLLPTLRTTSVVIMQVDDLSAQSHRTPVPLNPKPQAHPKPPNP